MKKLFLPLFFGLVLVSSCSKDGYLLNESYDTSNTVEGSGDNNNESGVITAGEWRDSEHWNFWKNLKDDQILDSVSNLWNIYPYRRIDVKLLDGDKVVPNTNVVLNVGGLPHFETRTDHKGHAILWHNLYNSHIFGDLEIKINNYRYNQDILYYEEGINEISIPSAIETENQVDICFVVDGTGSMGDEIQFLKSDLRNVLNRTAFNTSYSYRTSAVFYRDEGDQYIVRNSSFSTNINQTDNFIRNQSASGGGDYPEAVDLGLEAAIKELQWNSNAQSRLLFLLLDAPPHNNKDVKSRLKRLITLANTKGIKIIPIVASGINKETEFLMRFMALATNGTYVFITNDSGVGDPHIQPTVGEYKVEYLNDLLVRLITEYSE